MKKLVPSWLKNSSLGNTDIFLADAVHGHPMPKLSHIHEQEGDVRESLPQVLDLEASSFAKKLRLELAREGGWKTTTFNQTDPDDLTCPKKD